MQLQILKSELENSVSKLFVCEKVKLLMGDAYNFHTKSHYDINIPQYPFSEGSFHSI